MRLHTITNTNKIIEKKVNYFADYFSFVCHFIGEDELHVIETPQSIFENISIQLESNIEKCAPYFDKYISNELIANYQFKVGKNLIASFYNSLKDYKVILPKDKHKWLKTNKSNLHKLCLRIINRISVKIFKESVKSITSFLRCSHEIKYHIKELKYFTKIIVSDFLLNEFTKEDLYKIFEFILSSDEDKFPFNRSLFFRQDKILFQKIKEDFIVNRNFDSQFEGITNFRFKPFSTAYLLYKIQGLYLEKDQKEKFEEINLFSSDATKFKKLREHFETRPLNYFSNSENFTIAVIKLKYRSESFAQKKALLILKNFTRFFNSRTSYNCIVDYRDVIFTTDFKNSKRSVITAGDYKTTQKYSERDFLNLRRASFRMKSIKSEALEQAKEFEFIYESAQVTNSLQVYWQYLESMHKGLLTNSKNLIESTSKILLNSYQDFLGLKYKEYIYYLMINDYMGFGITKEEYRTFLKINEVDIKILKTRTKNLFLIDLLDLIESETKRSSLESIYKFYTQIFLELSEYRNHFIHAGKTLNNIEFKLSEFIPILISRYRSTLYGAINSNKGKNLNSIYQILSGRGEKLIG